MTKATDPTTPRQHFVPSASSFTQICTQTPWPISSGGERGGLWPADSMLTFSHGPANSPNNVNRLNTMLPSLSGSNNPTALNRLNHHNYHQVFSKLKPIITLFR